jgi:phage shock protein PspC (stress-responsive transcriptional regulator)
MQKVIAINLNGQAYQLDEPAYEALRAYLDRAEVQLKDNPDLREIMADLEQAIADKCNRFLGPHKTVVTASEVEQIVKEMGPVDDGTDQNATKEAGVHDKARSAAAAQKRLYQIREGAMLCGVCNGLAAYFNVDVTVVRIIFVVLAVLTKGAWILAYFVMAFVIPPANTSEEHAAAHGLPFSAQELIDQAKKHYAQFKDGREWRQQWRRQQRQWKAQWRQTMREQRRWWAPTIQQNVGYATQIWAGLMVPIFGIVSAAFFVLLALSIMSLVNTGAVFGWALPQGTPLWAGILILIVLYHVVASPIRAARHASLYAYGRYHYGWFAFWDGLFSLGLIALFGWLLYQQMDGVHTARDFIKNIPAAWKSLFGY